MVAKCFYLDKMGFIYIFGVIIKFKGIAYLNILGRGYLLSQSVIFVSLTTIL